VLIVALPLSGWWFNSIAGKPLQFFKMFNLPALAAANPDMQELAQEVHEYLFWFLVLLLVAHVGGALKHHMLDRDNTLLRMLPFRRLRGDASSQGDRP
jgi:cytochrome b561